MEILAYNTTHQAIIVICTLTDILSNWNDFHAQYFSSWFCIYSFTIVPTYRVSFFDEKRYLRTLLSTLIIPLIQFKVENLKRTLSTYVDFLCVFALVTFSNAILCINVILPAYIIYWDTTTVLTDTLSN